MGNALRRQDRGNASVARDAASRSAVVADRASKRQSVTQTRVPAIRRFTRSQVTLTLSRESGRESVQREAVQAESHGAFMRNCLDSFFEEDEVVFLDRETARDSLALAASSPEYPSTGPSAPSSAAELAFWDSWSLLCSCSCSLSSSELTAAMEVMEDLEKRRSASLNLRFRLSALLLVPRLMLR